MRGRIARGTPMAAVAGLGLVGLVLAAMPVGAETPGTQPQASSETKTFENAQYHFTVAVPAGCRHEEGPGTLDTICAPDLDPERSAVASQARALLLSVTAKALPADADTTGPGLQQRYSEGAFKEDLPASVCGETDPARVKVESLKQDSAPTLGTIVYRADIVCAPVKFLQIGERHASVVQAAGPQGVFRLVARAQDDDFKAQRATIDAFFASFHVRQEPEK